MLLLFSHTNRINRIIDCHNRTIADEPKKILTHWIAYFILLSYTVYYVVHTHITHIQYATVVL